MGFGDELSKHEAPETGSLPDGEYVVEIVEAKFETSQKNSANTFYKMQFKIVAPKFANRRFFCVFMKTCPGGKKDDKGEIFAVKIGMGKIRMISRALGWEDHEKYPDRAAGTRSLVGMELFNLCNQPFMIKLVAKEKDGYEPDYEIRDASPAVEGKVPAGPSGGAQVNSSGYATNVPASDSDVPF